MGRWGVGVLVGLLSSAFPLGTATASCGVLEDEEIRPYGKVRWGDFRGPKPDRRTEAQIAMTLRVFYDTEVSESSDRWLARTRDVCVAAVMHKPLSSVHPVDRTPAGLEHEQAHFDITEYFARKLSAELRSFEASGRSGPEALRRLERTIRKHYRETVAAWQLMQKRYDRDTNHGGRALAQEQWRRNVRNLLGLRQLVAASR